MDYVAIGNTMVDSIIAKDGTVTAYHTGGPAPFALNGMKLWTDSCQLITNVGKDYDLYYADWMKDNNITYDGVNEKLEKTHNIGLIYNDEDGTYSASEYMDEESMREIRNSNPTPDEIRKNTVGAKAIYYFYSIDKSDIWAELAKMKKEQGFEIMWEIYQVVITPKLLPLVKDIIKTLELEMFSINYPETKDLFGIEGREECIAALKTLGVPFIIMRDGAAGMYVIENDKHWLIPSITFGDVIDPTGCGNCSTGAVTYAYHATKDPILAGIMGNIASAHNLAQFGLSPLITEKMRADGLALAKKLRKDYE